MKKITRCALGLAILFSSCTKEPNWVRNYCQPVNTSNPTDIQRGSNINWSEGMTDAECIKIIKGFDSYDPSKPIFLSPTVYDLSHNDHDDISVNSPNPDYMLFPHVINSMSDTWSHDYIDEFKALKQEHGNEGVQMFLDKYLQGDSTLGMKLKPLWF